MHRRRAVDGRDHRRLDFQQISQQAFGVRQHVLGPDFRRNPAAAQVFLVDEGGARTGKNDHLVFRIGGDVGKAVAQFLMRRKAPDEVLILAVQRQLQNAVFAVELDVLIFF